MDGYSSPIATRDPDEAVALFSEVYCPHRLRLQRAPGDFFARQAGGGLRGLRLYELTYGDADVTVDPVPFDDFVLVTRPRRGRFVVRTAADGDVPTVDHALVMDAYAAYQLRWQERCRVQHLVIGRADFERIAGELRGFDEPARVHFQLGPPVSPSAGRAWSRTTQFLAEQLDPRSGIELGPLARAELVRLTVAGLLDAYPSTCGVAEPARAETVAATAVRRAVAYIEQHAADPIGVHDIARAARMSSRGLQAAFQRYEQTTPMHYLRTTRMRRAHAELRAGHPENTTVAAIATRWGFLNQGRFAAEYRAVYGQLPRDALAGTSADRYR
jgi:AraC-like DNA-binding protein